MGLFLFIMVLLLRDMWRYLELLNKSLSKLGNGLKGMDRDVKKMQSVRMTLKPGGRRFDTPSRKALEAAKMYRKIDSFNLVKI